MDIVYTNHAEVKLNEKEPKKLRITKNIIQSVVRNPDTTDFSDKPVILVTGNLNKDHSLCVVYKYVQERILIITFFPARKGRYESKILS